MKKCPPHLQARPLRNGPAGNLPAIEEGKNLAPSTPEHSAVKPDVEGSTSESSASLPQMLAFQTSPSDSLSPSSVFSNSPTSSQLPAQRAVRTVLSDFKPTCMLA